MDTRGADAKPISMSPWSMARIWEGRKSETRRVVNHPGEFCKFLDDGRMVFDIGKGYDVKFLRSRYGPVGQYLWVRERMRVVHIGHDDDDNVYVKIQYGDGKALPFRYGAYVKWPERLKGKPVLGRCLPYGGFKEVSRLLLRRTEARVERIQDIDDDGIYKEGVGAFADESGGRRAFFMTVWDKINLRRGYGWETNPLVEVVGFEVVAWFEGWLRPL